MSDDNINYALRPNKAVERKIVFNGLARLSKVLNLQNYGYVGLGSVWFVDFVLAHKALGINKLISIERSAVKAARARFNRPFKCVEVLEGDTGSILPDLDLTSGPSLIWLDYTDTISHEILKDIATVVRRAVSGTICMITINANMDALPKKDVDGNSLSTEESLRNIAGDAVPAPLSNQSLQRINYPNLLRQIIFNYLDATTKKSGRPEAFIKLFDLAYADGQVMVTIGGILAPVDINNELVNMTRQESWEGISAETIRVPALTIKEKLALDQVLPSVEALTADSVEALGFQLRREQIDMYAQFYRYYPSYGELAL